MFSPNATVKLSIEKALMPDGIKGLCEINKTCVGLYFLLVLLEESSIKVWSVLWKFGKNPIWHLFKTFWSLIKLINLVFTMLQKVFPQVTIYTESTIIIRVIFISSVVRDWMLSVSSCSVIKASRGFWLSLITNSKFSTWCVFFFFFFGHCSCYIAV